MSKTKIQVGPGTGQPLSQKKGLYGKRSSGKYTANGGFNNCPTVDFTKISDKRWAEIFGLENIPKWKRELIEAGESIE